MGGTRQKVQIIIQLPTAAGGLIRAHPLTGWVQGAKRYKSYSHSEPALFARSRAHRAETRVALGLQPTCKKIRTCSPPLPNLHTPPRGVTRHRTSDPRHSPIAPCPAPLALCPLPFDPRPVPWAECPVPRAACHPCSGSHAPGHLSPTG